MFWNRCPLLVDAIFDLDEDSVERLLYSMSNTLTSASPAAVTSVLSFEYGMNLTENMFAECPVTIVVVRVKGEVEESG